MRNNWETLESLDSVTRLTESEARANGVGEQLHLTDCLDAEVISKGDAENSSLSS